MTIDPTATTVAGDEPQSQIADGLPGLGIADEVPGELRRSGHQLAFASLWAEPCIHREHSSIAGVRSKKLHGLLGGTPRILRIGGFVCHEQDVGIGEQIEFVTAEPAQRHHRKPGRWIGDGECRLQRLVCRSGVFRKRLEYTAGVIQVAGTRNEQGMAELPTQQNQSFLPVNAALRKVRKHRIRNGGDTVGYDVKQCISVGIWADLDLVQQFHICRVAHQNVRKVVTELENRQRVLDGCGRAQNCSITLRVGGCRTEKAVEISSAVRRQIGVANHFE